MTNNEKIALWVGLDTHTCDPHSFHCEDCFRGSSQTPDYENSDAAAVTLLSVLVEKGYDYLIDGDADRIEVEIFCADSRVVLVSNLSISAAITSAILQLIESEASNEL